MHKIPAQAAGLYNIPLDPGSYQYLYVVCMVSWVLEVPVGEVMVFERFFYNHCRQP